MSESSQPDAVLAQAESLRQQGRHADARTMLEALLVEQPGHAETHYRLAQLAANAGNPRECRDHLQRACEIDPGNADYGLRFANVCERLAEPETALSAYRSVLQADPRNVGALIRVAELEMAAGHRDAAVDACQRVVLIQGPVAAALRDPRLPPPLRQTLQRIRSTLRDKYQELLGETRRYLSGRYAPQELERIDAALRSLGDTRAAGGHPLQKPEFLAFPGLEPRPWFDPGQFEWTEAVESNWQGIRDEYLALNPESEEFHPYIHPATGEARTLQGTDFSTLAGNRDWRAYHLNKAGWLDDPCARCPQTSALMRSLPLAEAAGYMPEVFYSVLQPGTEIIPHYGQTNVRLTVHLGLIVPESCGIKVADETRHWEPGRVLAFDDSFEHAAWNRGDSPRVVLIFEAWHPGLTGAEIDGLQHFFKTRSEWLARFADIAPQGSSHA